MLDSVENFLDKYYFFAKNIHTGNKKKFESINMIYIVMEAIKALIVVIEENRLSEIDTSTLNNLIHFSKVYVDTVSPLTTSNAKKTVILELTKEIEKLETLLNNQEISPKR